jgi:hypothetical protein
MRHSLAGYTWIQQLQPYPEFPATELKEADAVIDQRAILAFRRFYLRKLQAQKESSSLSSLPC